MKIDKDLLAIMGGALAGLVMYLLTESAGVGIICAASAGVVLADILE